MTVMDGVRYTATDRLVVESLLEDIAREEMVIEAHVHEETHWVINHEVAHLDLEDHGVRYSRSAHLTIVPKTDPTHEIHVADLILEGDRITHYGLNQLGRFDLVSIAAAALR